MGVATGEGNMNVNVLVEILYYRFAILPLMEKWVWSTWNLSALFLVSVCGSIITLKPEFN